MLQLGDRIGRPHVLFATNTESIFATGVERIGEHWRGTKGILMQTQGFFGHFEDADPFDIRRRALEILFDQGLVQTDGFKDLRTTVGHVGRDAHLGHDLAQSLAHRLDVVVDRLFGRQFSDQTLGSHIAQGFHRQIRVHRFGTVTCEQGEVMGFTRRASFDDQTGRRAQALLDQVLVDRRGGQQRGNRDMRCIDLAVGDDQDVVTRAHGILGLRTQRGELGFNAVLAPLHRITDVEFKRLELVIGEFLDLTDLRHVLEVQDRLGYFEAHRRVDVVEVEQVRLRADEGHRRHHERFADRIDRRVRHLCKELLEVVVEGLVLVRHHRQR